MRDTRQSDQEANLTSFLAAGIALAIYLGAGYLACITVYVLLTVVGR